MGNITLDSLMGNITLDSLMGNITLSALHTSPDYTESEYLAPNSWMY
jgi:hypothetical protein